MLVALLALAPQSAVPVAQEDERGLYAPFPDAVAAATDLPPGFVDEPVLDTPSIAVGMTFDGNGRMYLWERNGRVWIAEDGELLPTPLIDIHEEVGNWRDFGLLGFALDPGFLQNGDFYLYYVVDRHHLLNAGTPSYDAGTNEYYAATIGRITRYTADPSTGYASTLPGSRTVLLGETPDSGVPILHESHGTGSLMFGTDGTLLATSGDGASYSSVDTGSAGETYWSQALADGIIRPAENVGAFRSQMIDSYSGKILRLDPATGDGVSSNPFFDPTDPRSARSRTWALGLRNPFRAALEPGTGSLDPSVGDPGTVYVGDVGWGTWEDLHVVDEPGMNLGWPLFEGLTAHTGYTDATTFNLDAPNPLSCASWFPFQALLEQEQKDHNPSFPNPCDAGVPIAPGTPVFMHHRPAIEWRHGSASPKTRTPSFDGNDADESVVGSGGAVSGTPFNGNCAVGGFVHSGLGMPEPYGGAYFVADFAHDWIRCFRFDEDGHQLESVHDFATVGEPVFLTEDPDDGSLLYITIDSGELRRVRYIGGFDAAPVVALRSEVEHGATPLTVPFDATESYDPEGSLLSFAWDFGDGSTSAKPSPIHTFTGDGQPTTRTVTLTVTDDGGQQATSTTVVHLDNSPPVVTITSPVDGSTYSTTQATIATMTAGADDAESGQTGLTYAWEVFLHHNTHSHPEPVDTAPSTTAVLSPTPCSGEYYAYRLKLTVTDPQGLSAWDDVWLFPDCSPTAAASVSLSASDAAVYPGQQVLLSAVPTGSYGSVQFYADGAYIGQDDLIPFELPWTPSEPGSVQLSAVVQALDGTANASTGVPLTVLQPEVERQRLKDSSDDAEEKLSNGYMRVSNVDLELTRDNNFLQLVGMRFPVEVPPGAHIASAHIQFHADETGAEATVLEIRAEDVGVPALVSSQKHDLSSRPTTDAFVAWTPGPWDYVHSGGLGQRTPDLAPILEELVARPDWSNPGAVLFLVSGTGVRVAEAVDGTASLAPELVVEFGGGSNNPPLVGAGPDLTAVPGTPTPLAGSVLDDGLPDGTLNVLWSVVSGPGAVAFGDATDPQTSATFAAEGAYVLRLSADDGLLQAFDDVSVQVLGGPTTSVEVSIAAGGDDAEERTDSGYMILDSVDLELGFDNFRPHMVGLRFALPVPQGAAITDASLIFTVDESQTGSSSLEIRAEASDDASPIGSTKYDLSSRTATDAFASWQPPAWTTIGSEQTSPNIAAVLQEVVSRPGWQTGSHVLVLIEGMGTRTAESLEGEQTASVRLRVDYQE